MKAFFVALLLSGYAVFTAQSHASMVITFGTSADFSTSVDTPLGPFVPGQMVTIPVLAHVTGLTSVSITDFTIPIDFGGTGTLGVEPTTGNGYGIPNPPFQNGSATSPFTAIGYNAGAFSTYVFNDNLASFRPFDKSMNGTASGSGVAIGDAANPTTLFELTFTIAAGTPEGLYNVVHSDFGPLPITSFVQPGGTQFTDFVFDQGQFQVSASAVPEPASTAIAAGLFLVGGVCRWRKRRGSAEV